jgi:hypothetical protein
MDLNRLLCLKKLMSFDVTRAMIYQGRDAPAFICTTKDLASVLIVRLGAFGSRETREISWLCADLAPSFDRRSVRGFRNVVNEIDHFGESCFQLGDVRF